MLHHCAKFAFGIWRISVWRENVVYSWDERRKKKRRENGLVQRPRVGDDFIFSVYSTQHESDLKGMRSIDFVFN